MMKKVTNGEKEVKVSSGSVVGQIKEREREIQQKLDNLITLYLDGDIPKKVILLKRTSFWNKKYLSPTKLILPREERNTGSNPCGNGF